MIKFFKNIILSTIIIFTILSHNNTKACFNSIDDTFLINFTVRKFRHFLLSTNGKYCLKEIGLKIKAINFEKLITKIRSLNEQQIKQINIVMRILHTHARTHEITTSVITYRYQDLISITKKTMMRLLIEMKKIYYVENVEYIESNVEYIESIERIEHIEDRDISYISYLYLESFSNLLQILKQYIDLLEVKTTNMVVLRAKAPTQNVG